MIQLLTRLKVADSSGARIVKCIKVLGPYKKKTAHIGDRIVVVLKNVDPKKKKVSKGAIRRALVIRSGQRFSRAPGIFIKFGENACVIINRKNVPVTNRLKGPILRETCLRYPGLGSIATYIL